MSQDRPSREVAWRLFAAEFDDADYSYAESDEERAPNYVVTPTGARVNRLFVVGVLTEVEQVSDDVLRARVVDPTGAFVVYAGQYQPDALAALERLDTPTFVAVTGKARTFEPDDADTVYTSVRPESISEVDAETRDRWVVRTAEQTIDRIGAMADALGRDARGDELREALVSAGVRPDLAAGIPVAIDHYGTTGTYLDALRTVAVQAAQVVAGEREEVDVYTPAPDEGGPVDADLAADLDVPETTDSQAPSESETADSADAESAADAEPGDTGAGEETGVEAESGPGETEAVSEEETSVETEAVASESGSAVEGEPEAADAGDVGTTEELAESTAPEPESVEPEVEESTGDLGDFDAGSSDSETAGGDEPTSDESDESPVETDEMYEFDEEERAEIEEEFDMDFSSGEDIPEAGEAGIDAEPEEPEETEGVEDEASTADDTGADADAASFEGDLEDVVVDVMDDLDEGDGVSRDEVVRTVVEEYGAETGDVEDAIQSALMSGRCYESGEDTLKAI